MARPGGSQAQPKPLRLALARNVEAPGIARAAVSEMSAELDLSPSAAHTLLLLVSEVVSNAVLHSAGPPDAPIGLTADVSDEAITIAVTDAGEGFVPRRRDPTRTGGGYGLYLLEKAASRWGVDGDTATRVWFELQLGS
jgi:anti-sigma regulatory factor (Ser/Thr protein kinase)